MSDDDQDLLFEAAFAPLTDEAIGLLEEAATEPLDAGFVARIDAAVRERLSAPAKAGPGPATTPTTMPRILLSCSYCHSALERKEAVYCASCLAPHHGDCFETHGRCSLPGCGETAVVRRGRTPSERRRRLVFVGGGVLLNVIAIAALALWPEDPQAHIALERAVGRVETITLPRPVQATTTASLLGMTLGTITPELQQRYRLRHHEGLVVLDPGRGELALQEGDHFWMVGTTELIDLEDFARELLAASGPEPSFWVSYCRQTSDLDVTHTQRMSLSEADVVELRRFLER